MNKKAEFAVKILKQYALENQVLVRSTSDLSEMEQWLILQLMKASELDFIYSLLPESCKVEVPEGLDPTMYITGTYEGDKLLVDKVKRIFNK